MSEINLNEISAADFLQAVDEGLITLDESEYEKTAGDLSEYSTEDLLEALVELEQVEESMHKEASSPEEEYYYNAGRLMAQGYADELTKVANGGLDLNDLSVDEFITYAATIEDEMTKEAAGVGGLPNKAALMEMLRQMQGKARAGMKSVGDAYNLKKTYKTVKKEIGKARYQQGRHKKGIEGAAGRRNQRLMDAGKSALKSTAAYGIPTGASALAYNKMKK